MKNIQLLNKIAKCGTDIFDKDIYNVADTVENPDAIMVRSAVMHDMEFGDNLKAIARAGAGVNNIPLDKCAEQGIVVFNTPGANANGVKELVVCGMLLACRDVVGGINWVKSVKDDAGVAKLVEKEKSKFAGTEVAGKTLGIIGLGAIGGPLANVAVSMGMNVIGCDPYMSVDAAWKISRSVKKVDTREDIFAQADFISIHTPLIDNADPKVNTKFMINKDTIAMMKDGVIILNFARDALVNDDDIEEALKSGKVRRYVTDFPNARTAGMDGVIAIPHLGASTEESEDNCAVMAAEELVNYLETGNIKNSVNYPSVEMPHHDGIRLVILHRNIPNMISHISSTLAAQNINIENLMNRSKGDYAVTLVDTIAEITADMIDTIQSMDGIIRVIKIG
ncbi:MAG: 3-phosphoglycerate dehydrogenase [Ruminococcaceae bacterium]|nr:3-phosphoglycerate dehydrogenase [Oscillospiraceae bacterium]